MNSIDRALECIRSAHAKLGTPEFARRSGVPYSTVIECARRDFVGRPVETLRKLSSVAEQLEADEINGDGGDDAGRAA